MKALIIVLSILLFIFILLLLPLKLKIIYNGEPYVTVKWLFLKFKVLPGTVKEKNKKEAKNKNKKADNTKNNKKENVLEKIKKEKGTIEALAFLKDVTVSALKGLFNIFKNSKLKYSFTVTYGEKDPAKTGIVYGIINAAVYGAVALVNNTFVVKEQNVNINSDFDNECFKCEINAEILFKPLTVLKNAILILIAFLKAKNRK